MKPLSAAPIVLLKVNFDADQLSSLLRYRLERPAAAAAAAEPPPEPDDGMYADSLHFGPGEQLSVRVVGGGGPGFAGFQVVDACFITRPQVLLRTVDFGTQFAPPSLFVQSLGATLALGLDLDAGVPVVDPDGYLRVAQTWKSTLDVVGVAGIWELSFVLTVRILRGDGSEHLRVFSFDPESEVGGPSTVKRH
jgi:hypothetical protein